MQKTLQFPKLEPWQEDVYQAFKGSRGSGEIHVVKAKRQVGKTALAQIIILTFAVEKKSTICLIEPTLNQSRRVFKQMVSMLQQTGLIKSSNGQTLSIELSGGSEILFKSAEQKEALRGMTLSLLVIDEGAFITTDVYQLLYPTVDAKKAPLLVISTPLFQSGDFYELYMQGLSDEFPHVHSYDWSKYDTSKYLSQEKLCYYRQTLSHAKYTSEYLGEFITDGSYVFGDVRSCIGQRGSVTEFIGIDWGSGSGEDYTVVVGMDSSKRMTEIIAFNNLTPTEQIERIKNIINNNSSLKKVQVELNSIGKIYYDMLYKGLTHKNILQGFNTTNDSKRRIIENLVTSFNKKELTILNDAELLTELEHYAMEKTSKGYTYNGVSGYHDDYCIALALCLDTVTNNKGTYSIR